MHKFYNVYCLFYFKPNKLYLQECFFKMHIYIENLIWPFMREAALSVLQ